VLFILNDVENRPENQIIHSCLAGLRHDGSDVKRQFEKTLNPASRGFLLSGDTTGVFAKVHCISTPVISPHFIQLLVFLTPPCKMKSYTHL
ncbi:hypothetical protein, partial [Bacillus cereus]|uniref:hypothetical protein n=1 Tax=Bacillus cereus TaxID=1396 RepID=UPI00285274BB